MRITLIIFAAVLLLGCNQAISCTNALSIYEILFPEIKLCSESTGTGLSQVKKGGYLRGEGQMRRDPSFAELHRIRAYNDPHFAEEEID